MLLQYWFLYSQRGIGSGIWNAFDIAWVTHPQHLLVSFEETADRDSASVPEATSFEGVCSTSYRTNISTCQASLCFGGVIAGYIFEEFLMVVVNKSPLVRLHISLTGEVEQPQEVVRKVTEGGCTMKFPSSCQLLDWSTALTSWPSGGRVLTGGRRFMCRG